MFGNRHGNTGNIHFLKRVLSQHGKGYIRRNRHHGDGIHIGSGNPCNKICGTGAAGSQTDSHLSRSSCIAVSRVGRSLFMGGQHMKDFSLVFIQGIIDV